MSNATDPKAGGLAELIATLQADAGLGKPNRLPPVHLWNPETCGDIGLEIRKDGAWWQDGVRFSREKLVRLFSTILRKDSDGYWLVTPHEKVSVRVEDAPFIAIRADRTMDNGTQVIVLTTNVGDVVAVDGDHPLRVHTRPGTSEPAAYVRVRDALEARLGRPAWYDVVGWADLDPLGRTMSVASSGARFPVGEIA